MQSCSRGLREFCRLLGYSSQAYYQYRSGLQQRGFKEELLIQQVIYHRRLQPRLGARKLLVMMQPFMDLHRIHIGRDMFFELLRANGFLIRRRRGKPRTTFSAHRFKKYPDLVKGLTLFHSDELWVSDITYITLNKGFAYLSLVTDAHSRKIMGYRLSPYLASEGCLNALKMALEAKNNTRSLIHHSDRGIQYCSAAYIKLLTDNHIQISMTQSGNPRDNAIAERVNGIIKHELLSPVYDHYQAAELAVDTAIDTYNRLRPHSSVDMLTPEKAHLKTGEIRRRWKSYFKATRMEVTMDS